MVKNYYTFFVVICSYEGLTVFSEEAGDNLRRTLLHLIQENEKKQMTIKELQTGGTKKKTNRFEIFYISINTNIYFIIFIFLQ